MIERDAVQAIAQWMYQHQKGVPSARLAHADPATRAVFVGDALELLSPERREERANRVNAAKAHDCALDADPQESVMKQARQDVATFSDPLVQTFLTTNPRFCPLCRTQLISNRVDVRLTDNIMVEAHGLCCAQNERRFEFVSEFLYQLKGAK